MIIPREELERALTTIDWKTHNFVFAWQHYKLPQNDSSLINNSRSLNKNIMNFFKLIFAAGPLNCQEFFYFYFYSFQSLMLPGPAVLILRTEEYLRTE